jgi:hypothetical protein
MQSDGMSKIEAKLTIVLARETYGRQRNDARMTWDEMQALAGISRSSLNLAIDMVEQRGFFFRARRSTWVATIPNEAMSANDTENSTKIEPNEDSNSTKIVPNSTKIELNEDSNSTIFVLDDSTKIVPSSTREKKVREKRERKDPPTPQPQPNQTLAEMVNALAEATGMSGHLNWSRLSELAHELLAANYTAAQVAAAYAPTGWWYAMDWRGQRGAATGVNGPCAKPSARGRLGTARYRPGHRPTARQRQTNRHGRRPPPLSTRP